MTTRVADLPDDPAILKGFIESMFEQLETLVRDNDRLRHQLELMRQRMFGRRSEKTDPAQLMLFMAQILEEAQGGDAGQLDVTVDLPLDDESGEDANAQPAPEKKKNGHGRSTLPDHLPRVRREIPARPEDLVCD